jgi:hypothetical protein
LLFLFDSYTFSPFFFVQFHSFHFPLFLLSSLSYVYPNSFLFLYLSCSSSWLSYLTPSFVFPICSSQKFYISDFFFIKLIGRSDFFQFSFSWCSGDEKYLLTLPVSRLYVFVCWFGWRFFGDSSFLCWIEIIATRI